MALDPLVYLNLRFSDSIGRGDTHKHDVHLGSYGAVYLGTEDGVPL